MKCPFCGGDQYLDDHNGDWPYPCGYCKTKGRVSFVRWLWWHLRVEPFWKEAK